MSTVADRASAGISRRHMVSWLGLITSAVALTSCSPAPAPTQAPPASPGISPPATAPTPAPAVTQAPPKPKTLQPLEFQLSWTVLGTFAPYWVAVQNGFFADNGLDVKLREGKGSGTTLQLVANGQSLIGEVDAGVMMQGVQKGMDVRMVAGRYQRNTFGILSPADAPLAKPADLKGKTLAGAAGAPGEAMWPAFLKRTGMSEADVTIANTAASAKYSALLSRKVDGAFHQAPIDALIYEAQGFPVHQLLYADYKLDFLGLGMILLNKTIKDSPEMIRAFVAAVTKGHQWSLEHPTEAAALGKKLFTTDLTDATFEQQWKAIQPFTRTERTRSRPIFWMEKQDWEDTQNLAREVGMVPDTKPVETYYTNEFIPGS